MIWIDVAFRTATVASTIIATLRAGSRIVYLMDHDGIGIMDGPPIQNTNETYPLFELSEVFRHCVRLSFAPENYENVQKRWKPVESVVEPYPLSPRPYLPRQKLEDEQSRTSLMDTMQNNGTTDSSSSEGGGLLLQTVRRFFQWRYPYQSIVQSVKSIPTSISTTVEYLAILPKIVSYLTNEGWKRMTWRSFGKTTLDEVNSVNDDDDEGWDWNWSTEGELRFGAPPKESKDGIPVTSTRVAELSVFSPATYRHLRNNIFGITESDYHKSIFTSGPFVSFQSNSKGAARVGGVFFFTRDGTYMVKTIKKEEAKILLKILPTYHKHMKKYGRTSLLTRFCGMYGARIYDEDSLDHGTLHTFIVMNSAFPAEASRFISERFDLKGSTVGREVSEEELKTKGKDAVLKDLDLARELQVIRSIKQENPYHRAKTHAGLNIGPYAKSALLAQLREDVKFLVDCQVMDYSLLVGVVDMETFVRFDRSARQAIESVQNAGRKFATSKKWEDRALWTLVTPIRLLCAPPSFIAKQAYLLAHRTLSSIVTFPLPYYGSGKCGVDGGLLSVFHGTRNGKRALYYMGLIDFLQPWTTRKVIERQLKGLMGQDINAISCVTPEEYAARFLEFLDNHIS